MRSFFFMLCLLLTGCKEPPWNNPHPTENPNLNVHYTVLNNTPRTLDPQRSYNYDEHVINAQIYEPLVQFNYVKRPYTLEPLILADMPTVRYWNQHKRYVSEDAKDVQYTIYDFTLKSNIHYSTHPAFAKDEKEYYRYHHLTSEQAKPYHHLSDFHYHDTRPVTADDVAYAIKRIANPRVSSPIYGLMSEYIVGLKDLHQTLEQLNHPVFNLRNYSISGLKVLDPQHLRIIIKGRFPQFIYWIGMNFFTPVPWEADVFYHNPSFKEKNLTLDWYPVGSGPYQVQEVLPNQRVVLIKNREFHEEFFPCNPMPTQPKLQQRCGQRLPFIDKAIFTIEREAIPVWNKFLQGFYDFAAINGSNFQQALNLNVSGTYELSHVLKDKQITLANQNRADIYYMGFNFIDPVIGGFSLRAKKLRKAISLTIDYQEYIDIFANGLGQVANNPIPKDIEGHSDKPNPNRNNLTLARQLMSEAGYPNGIDPATHRPLMLHYDAASTGDPSEHARMTWLRKQFAKLGIALNIRTTTYNRFQQKMNASKAQIFSWGWLADHPDPANILFLFYGPNSKIIGGGENHANYQNPTYDRLFEKMRDMPPGHERQRLIKHMIEVLEEDTPWVWGYHSATLLLAHDWNLPKIPSAFGLNTLKYQDIDINLRNTQQKQWNRPLLWPLWVLLGAMILSLTSFYIYHRRRENINLIKRY